jgi:hypothetical protein
VLYDVYDSDLGDNTTLMTIWKHFSVHVCTIFSCFYCIYFKLQKARPGASSGFCQASLTPQAMVRRLGHPTSASKPTLTLPILLHHLTNHKNLRAGLHRMLQGAFLASSSYAAAELAACSGKVGRGLSER